MTYPNRLCAGGLNACAGEGAAATRRCPPARSVQTRCRERGGERSPAA
eukprot:CAMPEP_0175258906 /NCGR_PEP_ID=MMETSP0093-20121207/39465_1 /TAXON_ID=311494 /ORGANISM="Alexandrium monilatum, Strain CCMP3105" /LENGTH=47 /DNA_ID= /DNA_START= /DNA_END= /DNA_ORIENTATION=